MTTKVINIEKVCKETLINLIQTSDIIKAEIIDSFDYDGMVTKILIEVIKPRKLEG